MGLTAMLLATLQLLWLLLLVAISVWLPAAIGQRTLRPSWARLIEHAVMLLLFVTVAVWSLAPLRLLNPLTLPLAALAPGAVRWVIVHRHTLSADLRRLARWMVWRGAVIAENALDSRARLTQLRAAALPSAAAVAGRVAPAQLVTGGLVVVVAAIMLAPGIVPALANTRLNDAWAYGELLTTQRLLAGEGAGSRPQVFASVAAALSLMSSIAAVHVVRLLIPLVEIAMLMALLFGVYRTTAAVTPAVVAAATAWIIGVQQRPPSLELADACALLLLWCLPGALAGERRQLWVAGGCTVLAAAAAPATLPLLAIISVWLLLKPAWVLTGTGAAWLAWWWFIDSAAAADGGAAVHAAVNVALAAGLIGAGIVHALILTFRWGPAAHRLAIVTAATSVVIVSAMPRTNAARYVEYDAAARQTLAIASAFPRYRFMIVGPLEQWALSYGRGWHMNLHEFVATVTSPEIERRGRLPFHVDDVFVFVETRPFVTFPAEPADVPFTTLADPVFRYYRSLAGRASLQFEAHQICERLLAGLGGSIHFDDGRLRIYRFTLR